MDKRRLKIKKRKYISEPSHDVEIHKDTKSVEGNSDDQKPPAKRQQEEEVTEPPSAAACPQDKNWKKAKLKGKEMAAKKSADSKQRLGRKKKSIQDMSHTGEQNQDDQLVEAPPAASGDYDYLDKKDWLNTL